MIASTSLQAYVTEVLPSLSARHKAVMTAFKDHASYTNSELCEYLGWKINQVTPRVHELVEKGIVRQIGQRACKVTGRTAKVWELCPPNNQLFF